MEIGNQKQLNLNVNIDELPFLECEKCGNNLFQPAFSFKKVSPLIDGRGGLVPMERLCCTKCGHVVEPNKI